MVEGKKNLRTKILQRIRERKSADNCAKDFKFNYRMKKSLLRNPIGEFY